MAAFYFTTNSSYFDTTFSTAVIQFFLIKLGF